MGLSKEQILQMFQEKKDFVESIGETLSQYLSHIEGCRYRVFNYKPAPQFFEEFLTIQFTGGATLVKRSSCNSLSAILSDIGQHIYGGYYDEIEELKEIENNKDWAEI